MLRAGIESLEALVKLGSSREKAACEGVSLIEEGKLLLPVRKSFESQGEIHKCVGLLAPSKLSNGRKKDPRKCVSSIE